MRCGASAAALAHSLSSRFASLRLASLRSSALASANCVCALLCMRPLRSALRAPTLRPALPLHRRDIPIDRLGSRLLLTRCPLVLRSADQLTARQSGHRPRACPLWPQTLSRLCCLARPAVFVLDWSHGSHHGGSTRELSRRVVCVGPWGDALDVLCSAVCGSFWVSLARSHVASRIVTRTKEHGRLSISSFAIPLTHLRLPLPLFSPGSWHLAPGRW